jgi:hypothetical protein
MRQVIREIVRGLVEEFLDEALRRDAYIERLYDTAKGALGEYLKARYAEVNAERRRAGSNGTEAGWDRETDTLLVTGFFSVALKKMKGGDARKAFAEVIQQLHKLVPVYLRWAKRHVADAFELPEKELIDPPDSVTDEFFARLENLFNEAQNLQE